MNFNKYILIPIVLLISSFIINLCIDYYIMPKRFVRTDQAQHFYDMKKWYDSNKLAKIDNTINKMGINIYLLNLINGPYTKWQAQ